MTGRFGRLTVAPATRRITVDVSAVKSHSAATSGMKETGALSAAIGEAVTGRRVIRAYALENQAAERAEASFSRSCS